MQPYLDIMNGQSAFRIAPFDQKAAIEAALAMSDALKRGGHRVDAASPNPTRTKIKFDRQIVAIAKAEGAHTVYSDDGDVHGYAKQARLQAYRTIDLDLPPEEPHGKLDF
jgi:predicted nucleic acid-binding protein